MEGLPKVLIINEAALLSMTLLSRGDRGQMWNVTWENCSIGSHAWQKSAKTPMMFAQNILILTHIRLEIQVCSSTFTTFSERKHV